CDDWLTAGAVQVGSLTTTGSAAWDSSVGSECGRDSATCGGASSKSAYTSVKSGTTAGGAIGGAGGTDGCAGKASPHDWQKCDSASLMAWQRPQNLRSSPAPHSQQNLASDALARLQRKQIR